MSIVIQVLLIALQLYLYVVFARILMSWLPIDRDNPIAQFIYDATEPALLPIREMMPKTGMMDFSVMVLVLIIYVVRSILRTL